MRFRSLKRQGLDATGAVNENNIGTGETTFNAEEVFKKVKSLLDSTIVGVRRPVPVPDPNIANIHSASSGSIAPSSYQTPHSK